ARPSARPWSASTQPSRGWSAARTAPASSAMSRSSSRGSRPSPRPIAAAPARRPPEPGPMAVRDASNSRVDGEALLRLIQEVAGELHAGRRAHPDLDSRLEDDLGLDSLARMELLLRIQRRFGVSLREREAL